MRMLQVSYYCPATVSCGLDQQQVETLQVARNMAVGVLASETLDAIVLALFVDGLEYGPCVVIPKRCISRISELSLAVGAVQAEETPLVNGAAAFKNFSPTESYRDN